MKEGFVELRKADLPSRHESVSVVENMIDEVCKTLHVNGDNYGNILIAVTEAVNNAIEHGNCMTSSIHFSISVGDSDSQFCFTVSDQGRGFDYLNLPDPTSPENLLKENGRGIFLMKSLSDEVVFEDAGSCVTVYFNK